MTSGSGARGAIVRNGGTGLAAMNVDGPREYFGGLQARIVAALEAIEGRPFRRDEWTRPRGGGALHA
jgi:coproporphyrinogen III oxidase